MTNTKYNKPNKNFIIKYSYSFLQLCGSYHWFTQINITFINYLKKAKVDEVNPAVQDPRANKPTPAAPTGLLIKATAPAAPIPAIIPFL